VVSLRDGERDAVTSAACEAIVPSLQRLIGFRTDIATPLDPPRDEAALQEFVATELERCGAEVDLFEPDPAEVTTHPMYADGQTFDGRPVLWARLPGNGGGRSLLFNGHIDTVTAEPVEKWSVGPWSGDVVDGAVMGRGACDMKGGIACALALAMGVHRAGVELNGDLLFNFVPFEEVNGMGAVATVRRGYRADGAICSEPTDGLPAITSRGILGLEITVEGRTGIAEIAQPHHAEGGAVSAVDKLLAILRALERLSEEWKERPDKQHDLLTQPAILTTLIKGGTSWTSWPPSASATLNICYLPHEADEQGRGSHVEEEIAAAVEGVCSADDWLSDHRPRLRWLVDYPSGGVGADADIVSTIVAASRAVEVEPELRGFDCWADQVTLIREGGIPCVSLGPGSVRHAHAVDERVAISELERCIAVYAATALAWTSVGPAARPG